MYCKIIIRMRTVVNHAVIHLHRLLYILPEQSRYFKNKKTSNVLEQSKNQEDRINRGLQVWEPTEKESACTDTGQDSQPRTPDRGGSKGVTWGV